MATALHPVPRWGGVAAEQVRTAGMAVRRELLLLAAVLSVMIAMTLGNLWENRDRWRVASGAAERVATAGTATDSMRWSRAEPAPGGEVLIGTGVGLEPGGDLNAITVPLAFVAVVLAFGVWRGDRASRRDYLKAMPVEQEAHLLTKVLAGWCWLLVALALCLATNLGLDAASALLMGNPVGPPRPTWHWLVPPVSASVVYLFASAAMIGSRRPWRWVGGAAVLFVLLASLWTARSEVRPLATATRALRSVVTGTYGMNAAMFGDIRVGTGPRLEFDSIEEFARYRLSRRGDERMILPQFGDGGRIVLQRMVPSARRWLGATALWTAIGAGLVGLALQRRRRLD